MLLSLQVRNFAIIDAVDLEFSPGMTVLTGETGAGKSILVDALGLVLGERGGTGLVRSDADRAEFNAEFDLSGQSEVRAWLAEHALDADSACVIRRVISADGRSRAFVNGNAVPLQSLQELGDRLLDIHGQHFHQSLGRRDVQRDLVDHFGNLEAQREEVGIRYAEWRSLDMRLRELSDAATDRTNRIDLLSFQTRELEALDTQPDEYESLLAERQRFRMSGQLVDAITGALQALFEQEDANVQSLIADACHRLEAAAAVDSQLAPVRAMLEEASIQVSEVAEALGRYRDNLDLDAQRRDFVEERLDAITLLARKHRVDPKELPEVQRALESQLEDLSNAESAGARLSKEAERARSAYLDVAHRLSDARRKAAVAFAKQVTGAMQGLGMPDGRFEAAISRREPGEAQASGLDDVTFRITANPGTPLMPLSKVASGGELSRMSLAIQVIASDGSAIPTMVFDEVDSGVGGGVAEMVGRRLAELGSARQVFCVTHLPQVASVADHHFRILKRTDGRQTSTDVTPLSEPQRVEELARMLGGVEVTQQSRRHAAEMRKLGKRPVSSRRKRQSSAG